MKFFKYWATGSAEVQSTGKPWSVRCYGASNVSVEDALKNAAEIARRAASAIRPGSKPTSYGYSDRPLREEVVEEFATGSDVFAVVTRNSYGSLVLNCARALFADIDYPEPTFLGSLKRLFGRRAQSKRDAEIIQRVNDLTTSSNDLGIRLYRTANGFRCLVTSGAYAPESQEARELLLQLGSDPLYIRLCHAQECFRARVSPKFWRCGAPRPPRRIPWMTDGHEREYRNWEDEYALCASAYSTCSFVGSFGNPTIDPSIEPVLSIHDKLSCLDAPLLA